MDWWKADAKYDYDIAKKIKAEGCRELKRRELECKMLQADTNKCEQFTHDYKKCERIFKYLASEH